MLLMLFSFDIQPQQLNSFLKEPSQTTFSKTKNQKNKNKMPKLVIVSQQEMNKTLSMGQKMTGISGRQMNTMNPTDLFSLLPLELCTKGIVTGKR